MEEALDLSSDRLLNEYIYIYIYVLGHVTVGFRSDFLHLTLVNKLRINYCLKALSRNYQYCAETEMAAA